MRLKRLRTRLLRTIFTQLCSRRQTQGIADTPTGTSSRFDGDIDSNTRHRDLQLSRRSSPVSGVFFMTPTATHPSTWCTQYHPLLKRKAITGDVSSSLDLASAGSSLRHTRTTRPPSNDIPPSRLPEIPHVAVILRSPKPMPTFPRYTDIPFPDQNSGAPTTGLVSTRL